MKRVRRRVNAPLRERFTAHPTPLSSTSDTASISSMRQRNSTPKPRRGTSRTWTWRSWWSTRPVAETLTASLYEACRARGIPVLTLIDKWDRPGKEPLRLLNEIRELARMTPAPLNWPVGPAGHMRAMIDLREADRVDDHQYGGATADLGRVAAARIYGNDWEIALAGVTALEGGHRQHRRPEFPALDATPVIFGSVLHGVGLTEVLDLIIDLTPGSRAESALTRQGFSDSEAARSPAS